MGLKLATVLERKLLDKVGDWGKSSALLVFLKFSYHRDTSVT